MAQGAPEVRDGVSVPVPFTFITQPLRNDGLEMPEDGFPSTVAGVGAPSPIFDNPALATAPATKKPVPKRKATKPTQPRQSADKRKKVDVAATPVRGPRARKPSQRRELDQLFGRQTPRS
jgi:hypothetical protein